MKRITPTLTLLIISLLLLFLLSACPEVAGGSNYTLTSDDAVDRPLFILAQNATLAKGASVNGSVVMLCCNLTVEADVKGDVFLLTGNLWVTSSADVDGDAYVLTGNVTR